MLARCRWRLAALSWPAVALWLLILAYVIFFSAYSLQRHNSLNSYAADLSFIDQPMWNTWHGRFLERTMDERQVSRVGEHLEPVIIPVSLVYLLWDDVRAILIIQTLALALGALPVYWIARRVLGRHDPGGSVANRWLPVAFAFAYLMFPALQAANIADFHADPFIVLPLLLAFWFALRRRYLWMWLWALAAMLTKENLPTVTFMFGLFLVVWPPETSAWARPGVSGDRQSRDPDGGWPAGRWHGLAMMAVSLAWFLAATFLLVAPLARQVYGTTGPVYLANRYTQLQGDVLARAQQLLGLLVQPARLAYLADLLAPVGWLALLGPEFLLPGLPVLVANYFSNFPGQYSGQQHYTAPLVPVFVVAAIYGARRLADILAGQSDVAGGRRARMMLAIAGWLLLWSLGYQAWRGWTPLARDFDWPQVTTHTRLAQRFFDQIPEGAIVSTTPPLHPHLAHRAKIYLYPTLADADYVLLDVAGPTDAFPNDVKATFDAALASGRFGILDAADGYVLLARGCGPPRCTDVLPEAFFDFVRVPAAEPQVPLQLDFALSPSGPASLRFLGYDVIDDPVWQQTAFRLYWQPLQPLPEDLQMWPFAFSRDGFLIEDPQQHPLVAPLWYPPQRWQPGETVVIETLPWSLGETWSLGLAVLHSDQYVAGTAFNDPNRRLPLVTVTPPVSTFQGDTWAQIGAFYRPNHRLLPDDAGLPTTPVDARFAGGVELLGYRLQPAEDDLSLILVWQTAQPLERDYTVFVHLIDPAGNLVAQSDSSPHWVTDWPTSRWVPGQPVTDGHGLSLPGDLADGEYTLRVGLYDWQTLDRLPLVDAAGTPIVDFLDLSVWRPSSQ